jgi:hypothetical protein
MQLCKFYIWDVFRFFLKILSNRRDFGASVACMLAGRGAGCCQSGLPETPLPPSSNKSSLNIAKPEQNAYAQPTKKNQTKKD